MSVACPLSLRKLPRMRTTVDGQPPRNTRIATPSNLSKPPPETVHYQGRTPCLQQRPNRYVTPKRCKVPRADSCTATRDVNKRPCKFTQSHRRQSAGIRE